MTYTIRITIAVAARGANMATRLLNESTVDDSAEIRNKRVSASDCPEKHSAKSIHRNSAKSAAIGGMKSSRKRQLLLMATLGLLISPSVGCTMATGFGQNMAGNHALDDFMIGYRNQAWAAKAWQCRKQRFCNKQFLGDFEKGFRAGYESVAQGGNGCVPAVCPQSYWGWQYQTADGQARMNAWFEAYPMGVAAAEEDGIGNWSQVQTSMPAPRPVAPVAALAPAAAVGASTAGVSDQKEIIGKPKGERSSSAKALPDTEATKSLPEPLDDLPKISSPPSPSLKTPTPPAPPKVTVPTPKAPVLPKAPIVPQPNSDPFGFD